MKILQINAVGQTASTGRTCKELAAYINEHTEHRCYTAFSEGTKTAYTYQIGTPLEKKLHALLSRLTGKQAHFSRRGTKRLLRYVEELQPDVVHLRNLHGNYIHLPMLLRYLAERKIATVVTLHDCWFYTGKCCHYTVDGCDRWETGCHHCPRLRKDNKSWFVDATAQLWKEKKRLLEAIPRLAVVGVSDWITGEAKRSFLSCAETVERIYNWIDLDVFYPRTELDDLRNSLNLVDQKVVLGVASGWSNAKGLDQFLTLAERLGEAYRVLLVGRMPEGISLPANVRHVPATNSVDELARYYSLADVFVTLSPEETFGKVSAEALACGTPVVCYDSTANGELVGEGCGYAVTLYDLKAVEQAVRSLASEDRVQIRERCCASSARFEKEALIRQHLTLYMQLLENT